MEEKEKYTIDDLKRSPNMDTRLAQVGIMIANELHNIYSVLWELKEKEKK